MSKQIQVVGAAILNDQNQILATQRADARVLGQQWEFPGGKIKAGETPEQALARELEEEFSVQAQVGPAVGPTFKHEYDFWTVNLTVYYVRLASEDLRLMAHGKVVWCEQTQLGKLDWAATDRQIAELIEQEDLTQLAI